MRSPARRGLLLAMEGIDGSGKTTQVAALASLLGQASIPFVATKEPTQGPWGRRIRESAKIGRLAPQQELEAFLLDREEHVADLIEPALREGKVVLVDRYYFSTAAYQGARGLDVEAILRRNAFAPAPDLLVVLDVPPEVGLKRVRDRGDVADKFELADDLTKARAIFRALKGPNLHLLDGQQPAAALTKEIAALLFAALGRPLPDR
jgi:dTMP kinase